MCSQDMNVCRLHGTIQTMGLLAPNMGSPVAPALHFGDIACTTLTCTLVVASASPSGQRTSTDECRRRKGPGCDMSMLHRSTVGWCSNSSVVSADSSVAGVGRKRWPDDAA